MTVPRPTPLPVMLPQPPLAMVTPAVCMGSHPDPYRRNVTFCITLALGLARSCSLHLPRYRYTRRRLAYPLFERSRTRNVCGGFCAAAALTEMNRSDSFDICMETTTLHAYIEGRPTNLLRKSCSCAEPDQRQKLRTRALHDENVRGGQVQP